MAQSWWKICCSVFWYSYSCADGYYITTTEINQQLKNLQNTGHTQYRLQECLPQEPTWPISKPILPWKMRNGQEVAQSVQWLQDTSYSWQDHSPFSPWGFLLEPLGPVHACKGLIYLYIDTPYLNKPVMSPRKWFIVTMETVVWLPPKTRMLHEADFMYLNKTTCQTFTIFLSLLHVLCCCRSSGATPVTHAVNGLWSVTTI